MANWEDEGVPSCFGFDHWKQIFASASADWQDGSLEQFSCLENYNTDIPFTCSVCKRGPGESCDLKHCSACWAALYCSREHQIKDFPKHKKVCKKIQALKLAERDISIIPSSEREWADFILYSTARLSDDTGLNSYLNTLEHCRICFATPFFTATRHVELRACSVCNIAHHCANPACAQAFSQRHTVADCERFFIMRAAVVMNMQAGGVLCRSSNSRSSDIPTTWDSYFSEHQKFDDFDYVSPTLLRMPPVMGALTYFLSMTMTVLHSLSLVYSKEELADLQSMELHALGAQSYECISAIVRHEELFHWLPKLRQLKIVFVGPKSTHIDQYNTQGIFCQACTSLACKTDISIIRGCYHEVQDKVSVSAATVVIACNAGIHDPQFRASWTPTVRLLASQPKLPVIFTGFTESEIHQDEAVLSSLGANIVVSGKRNAFRGLLPCLDSCEPETVGFYFANMYLCVFMGAK